MSGATPLVRLKPRRPCPICGKPSQHKFHPFCSRRCANIDLSKWLGGSYAVPAEEEPEPENAPPPRDTD
jgi:endogenous inhibitor of DNA gyrase (YacG/DUF329 family)